MVIRPFRDDDLDALAALDAACERDRSGMPATGDRLRQWLYAPGRRPHENLFVAAEDADLIGWIFVYASRGREWRMVTRGRVRPDRRRRGIGTALVARALARAGELADDAGAWQFDLVGPDVPGFAELCARFGMTRARTAYWMQRDLRAPITMPPLPPGVVIRPLRPGEEAAWCEAYNEAHAEQWNFVPLSLDEVRYWIEQPTYVREHDLVAAAGDEIAGTAYAVLSREDVEALGGDTGAVRTLGVRPRFRGRGIGRALLRAAARCIQAAGLRYAALAVDTVNPVLTLYEREGFQVEHVTMTYRRPLREAARQP